MNKLHVKIRGIRPLLMHNPRGANPADPLTRKKKELTGKRKKTDEDYELIGKLEFQQGMYYDEEVGPYVPADWLIGMIQSGAKANKNGKKVLAGVDIEDEINPLIYEGPRTMEKLLDDVRFWDTRPVNVINNKVMRVRPRFQRWELAFTILYYPQVIDKDELTMALNDACIFKGLGDYRPRYGKFEIVETK